MSGTAGEWGVFERKSKTSENRVYLVCRTVIDSSGRKRKEFLCNPSVRTAVLRQRPSTFRSYEAAVAAIAKATGGQG